MPRPNKGTDRLLIETGKKMLLKNGINGLTISAICKKARVNPGMFVYNFKSKEEYLDRVLNEIFEEYLIPLVPGPATDSVYDNMEHVLFFIAKASAKYPALMIQVGSETLTGDKTLIHAFKERVAQKTRGIFPLFKKAKEQGIISRQINLPTFILMTWPALIYSSASATKIMTIMPEEDKIDPELMISDEAIKERVRKMLSLFRPEVFEKL